ncbi:MAG: ADP-ribosylglycohydrolase family protein [Desulfobacter sp.]
MISSQERYRGALVGFLVAESLGSTTEFMSPAEVVEQYGVHREIVGGGHLDWPKGSITDDGDMTLCVARSLVACKGYNLQDIAARFVDWYNSDPIDMGHTVRAGLNRYIRTGELQRPPADDQAGNGGVMRELPLILYFNGSRDDLLQAVVEQARLTHHHPESDQGCRCYASVVAAALQGAHKSTIMSFAQQYPLFMPENYDGKAGGYIVETMQTVLHFFSTVNSFEEAVVGAVNRGQDADTCGAILGGLAGAHYGYAAIPQRWIEALDQDVLAEALQLADALLVMQEVTHG